MTDAVLLAGGLILPAFFGLAGLGRLVIDAWLGPGWSTAGAYVTPLAAGSGMYALFAVMSNAGEAHMHFGTIRRGQIAMGIGVLALCACAFTFGNVWFAAWMMLLMALVGMAVVGYGLDRDGLIDGRRLMLGLWRDGLLAVGIAIGAITAGYATYWLSSLPWLAVIGGSTMGLAVWLSVVSRTAAWRVVKDRGLIKGSIS